MKTNFLLSLCFLVFLVLGKHSQIATKFPRKGPSCKILNWSHFPYRESGVINYDTGGVCWDIQSDINAFCIGKYKVSGSNSLHPEGLDWRSYFVDWYDEFWHSFKNRLNHTVGTVEKTYQIKEVYSNGDSFKLLPFNETNQIVPFEYKYSIFIGDCVKSDLQDTVKFLLTNNEYYEKGSFSKLGYKHFINHESLVGLNCTLNISFKKRGEREVRLLFKYLTFGAFFKKEVWFLLKDEKSFQFENLGFLDTRYKPKIVMSFSILTLL